MSATRDFLKTATQRTIHALNRADEIGGEVRDYLQERIEKSDGAQRALARFKQFRGGDEAAQSASGHAATATAGAPGAAATPAAATEPTAAKGLGDSTVAAQIYGRSSCPWTGRSIRLMEDRKIDFDYIDMDEDENSKFEPELISETNQNTHPWIYLRGSFKGGFNALSEVDRLGQLDTLTMSPEERVKTKSAKAAQAAKSQVEIASREVRDEPPTPDGE